MPYQIFSEYHTFQIFEKEKGRGKVIETKHKRIEDILIKFVAREKKIYAEKVFNHRYRFDTYDDLNIVSEEAMILDSSACVYRVFFDPGENFNKSGHHTVLVSVPNNDSKNRLFLMETSEQKEKLENYIMSFEMYGKKEGDWYRVGPKRALKDLVSGNPFEHGAVVGDVYDERIIV